MLNNQTSYLSSCYRLYNLDFYFEKECKSCLLMQNSSIQVGCGFYYIVKQFLVHSQCFLIRFHAFSRVFCEVFKTLLCHYKDVFIYLFVIHV